LVRGGSSRGGESDLAIGDNWVIMESVAARGEKGGGKGSVGGKGKRPNQTKKKRGGGDRGIWGGFEKEKTVVGYRGEESFLGPELRSPPGTVAVVHFLCRSWVDKKTWFDSVIRIFLRERIRDEGVILCSDKRRGSLKRESKRKRRCNSQIQ